MKRTTWLWLCSLFLLLGLVGCNSTAVNPTTTPTTSSTSGPTSGAPTPGNSATAAVQAAGGSQTPDQLAGSFYAAVEAQNYVLAYAFLDPKATNMNDGSVFNQSSFVGLAQLEDSAGGVVLSFTDLWAPPQLVITGTRKQEGTYHAHLQLRQEGQVWKIVSLDHI